MSAAVISRRHFIGSTGGLVVAFHIPFAAAATTAAQAGSVPEINAWVVVQPDDTVVIRIARSEMGQGSLTGLAQLVAEELDCNWAKVKTEYPTPGQSLARKRVWGNFSTGGSRGIRESHDYVRKGGAIARTMLVQAAADQWKVPASECSAAASVITHTPTGRKTSYGKVAGAAAQLTPPTEVALIDALLEDRRIPERVRHALSTESGFYDGFALAAMLAALALASEQSDPDPGRWGWFAHRCGRRRTAATTRGVRRDRAVHRAPRSALVARWRRAHPARRTHRPTGLPYLRRHT